MSDIEGLFTPLPSFFFTVSVIFLIIGFIILNNNGVAAAPAVAKTAIATVVVDWFTEGRNFSTAVVDSYKVIQVFPSSLSSCPITFSSPAWVKSPILNWPGPGQATSSSLPRPPVSGSSGGSISGGADTGDIGGKEEVACPGPGQLRVGDLTQAGDEKVTGHELSADGKTCITLYEPTTAVEKFLPSTNQATTTLAVAVIATAGAAATPLLLRIVKPIIKKITDTIKKKLGKDINRPSISDKKTDEYRAKKGLPPVKRKW